MKKEEWDESWVTALADIWSNTDQMQWSYALNRAATFLKKHASDRRLRLFTVSICRQLGLKQKNRVANAIEIAQRFADDKTQDANRARWRRTFEEQIASARRMRVLDSDDTLQLALAMDCMLSKSIAAGIQVFLQATCSLDQTNGHLGHVRVLHDIFGNPFRPISFSPEWRTTTAVAIAQSMYESRDFGPMPLLADALQDAGCEVPEIIDHCRGPGPHVRGCWVVDGVLGKA